ncbi:MAG: ATP-binding protein [Pseudomonadota bacterium]
MSDQTERAYIARVLSEALADGRDDRWCVEACLGMLCANRAALSLALPEELIKAYEEKRGRGDKVRAAVESCLDQVIADLSEAGVVPLDEVARNVAWIAQDLDLSDLDRRMLELTARYIQMGRVESLVDALTPNNRMVLRALAFLLAVPRDQVQKRLLPEAPLVASGLVSVNGGCRYLTTCEDGEAEYLALASTVRRSLLLPFDTRAALQAAIFGPAQRGRLGFERFSALGADRDLAARVLRGAVQQGALGVNILLHGPAGSGKTEFARALANHLAVDLFAAGENEQAGVHLDWQDRLADLRFMGQLARRRAGTLLLFDEMEDIRLSAKRKDNRGVSKLFFNRMLEENPVPVIWTSNHIWDVDPAYLRRMTMIVEFKMPSAGERRRIWQSVIAESSLAQEPRALERFAERYEVTPAVAANAVKAAELAGGGLAELDLALRGMHGALTGKHLPPEREASPGGFDLDLLNGDTDLKRLIGRLCASDEVPAISLCLHGPPGTGKSAFAQHLARALGLKSIKKRGSDLFSMWVGETEKNIAEAFEQALAERALLIFDEADALLSHRSGATRSWEVSQVAEMLTWMEAHPLPFCCTTNLIEQIDPAALRRFLFKVKLDYLDRPRVARAFERFFGHPAPAQALALTALTPSDFVTVKRKAAFLDFEADDATLVELLAAECRGKPNRPQPIGFAV